MATLSFSPAERPINTTSAAFTVMRITGLPNYAYAIFVCPYNLGNEVTDATIASYEATFYRRVYPPQTSVESPTIGLSNSSGTYYFYMQTANYNTSPAEPGLWYLQNTVSYNLNKPSVEPSKINAGMDYLEIRCQKVQNATGYRIFYDDSEILATRMNYYKNSSVNTPITISGLEPSTTYYLRSCAYDSKVLTQSCSSWAMMTTLAEPTYPDPQIDSVDTSRGVEDVRIYWSCPKRPYEAEYSILVDGVEKATASEPPSTYTSVRVDTYNKTYMARIKYVYNGVTGYSTEFPFVVPLKKPVKWVWSNPAQTAFENKGPTTQLTREEWNNFLSFVNDTISWYNAYNSANCPLIYDSARMPEDDKTLYATDFSHVVWTIRQMVTISTTKMPTTYAKGDIVKGSYFIDLANAVNSVL